MSPLLYTDTIQCRLKTMWVLWRSKRLEGVCRTGTGTLDASSSVAAIWLFPLLRAHGFLGAVGCSQKNGNLSFETEIAHPVSDFEHPPVAKSASSATMEIKMTFFETNNPSPRAHCVQCNSKNKVRPCERSKPPSDRVSKLWCVYLVFSTGYIPNRLSSLLGLW